MITTTMTSGAERKEEEGTHATQTPLAGRGDEGTCCLGMKTPSILLRNMILPKDMWDEFPKGLTLSISNYFLYQPGFPSRPDQRTIIKPPAFNMRNYEEVWITTKDRVRLYAFFIKAERSATAPTLLFFHGNAGSIGDRLDNAKILHTNMPINLLLLEYRGYGPSKGSPSERGLYRDAKAAFRYLQERKDIDPRKLFVFGRSLGGAVAIHLCSRRQVRGKVRGLIVENTFTSVPSLARKVFQFPGVKYLPRWFYNNKYNNKEKMPSLRCPSLFISSKEDELLPQNMMVKLFSLCGSKRKDFAGLDAGHNDAYMCGEYVDLVQKFIKSVLTAPASCDFEDEDEDWEDLKESPAEDECKDEISIKEEPAEPTSSSHSTTKAQSQVD